MAKKFDMESAIKYAVMGLGAIAVPMLLEGVQALAPVLQNTFMQMGFQGVTIGRVVLAGLGIGVIDRVFYNK